MKCPHDNCNGKIDTGLIEQHAHCYGGSVSLVECPKCRRGVRVGSYVSIKLESEVYEGPATTGTWGGDIPAFPVEQVIPEKPNKMGYCPHCQSKVVSRERRINGNDKCENGHVFPSKKSLIDLIGAV